MATKPRAAKAANAEVPAAEAVGTSPAKPRPSRAKSAAPTAAIAAAPAVEKAVVPVATEAAAPATEAAAAVTIGSDTRIDYYPTHEQAGIKFRRGHVLPFGATAVTGGVNFSIYSAAATDCTLVLFERGEDQAYAEIAFPDEFRVGNVYSMIVFDLDFERLEYGFRMDGPPTPRRGIGSTKRRF